MRPPYHSPIVRLGVRPDNSDVMVARKRGTRRPHGDAAVAAVRRLIEETTLTYGEIAARTGVGRASICRWTRDQSWQRPLFAPRATDTVPRERASAKLRLRTLAARLAALADRAISELEASETVDLDRLAEALELVRMAKLATLGRRRRRREPAVDAPQIFSAGTREALQGLRAAGVRIERAPDDAVWDFIESRAPSPKRLTRRQREHAWLQAREE